MSTNRDVYAVAGKLYSYYRICTLMICNKWHGAIITKIGNAAFDTLGDIGANPPFIA